MGPLAIGMGIFGGTLDRWKMLSCSGGSRQREPLSGGAPPAPPASQESHGKEEVEQGKALTADVPEVEAFDNLGGDKKERDFRRRWAQRASDVAGGNKLWYQQDRGTWQQTPQAMTNQAP